MVDKEKSDCHYEFTKYAPCKVINTENTSQCYQAIKAISNDSFKEHFKEMWTSLTRPINVWTGFIAFQWSLLMAQFTVFPLRIGNALKCIL